MSLARKFVCKGVSRSMTSSIVHSTNLTNDSVILLNIKSQLKESMKSRLKVRSNVIKSVLAEYQNNQIDGGKKSIVDLINRGIKKRLQSIVQFKDRDDLIAIEEQEIVILREFLPTQYTEDEVLLLVKQVIEGMEGKLSVSSVMKEVGSSIDGSRVTGQVLSKVVMACIKV